MLQKKDYVWYASYGSNIQRNRFMCYVQGGQPDGCDSNYHGCRNKSLPLANSLYYIPSQLYFAKVSTGWHQGGVGFISNNFDRKYRTWSRMYLITKEQFIDVVMQENDLESPPLIDFEATQQQKSYTLNKNSWYGNLLYLGDQNGYPIFTFTSSNDFLEEINTPHFTYLSTIAQGLKEAFPYKDIQICDYLLSLSGIRGHYTPKQILQFLES